VPVTYRAIKVLPSRKRSAGYVELAEGVDGRMEDTMGWDRRLLAESFARQRVFRESKWNGFSDLLSKVLGDLIASTSVMNAKDSFWIVAMPR
jgi:hypothetical protein